MPTPADNVFWIPDLATLKGYTGATNGETIELLGYYAENDGGCGTFYWDDSSNEADLFSIIVQPIIGGVPQAAGRWKRLFDNTLDVKWFGAHPTQAAAVNDIGFQAALDYIKFDTLTPAARKNFNIFISKGNYDISASLSVDLADPIYDNGRMMLYGAGSQETNVHFVGTSGTVFHIKAFYNYITVIKDFSIWNFNYPSTAKGMLLDSLSDVDMHNVAIWRFETNLHLSNVLVSHFKNVYLQGGTYGIKAETGSYPRFYNPNTQEWVDTNARPNVILFSNCVIRFMSKLAVDLLDVCNVSFLTCAIEQNGSDNTPALTEVAGIDCKFTGDNGANGLNVKDCYFEGNKGLADIRVKVETGGTNNRFYGTHTFQGNTFNRNADVVKPTPPNQDLRPNYTQHNILIVGSGQDPKRLLGQNKGKLVFIGNGFFVSSPGSSNNYEPDPVRKPIEIQYFDDGDGEQYWEFDVVEQGNSYNGDPTYPFLPGQGKDAPVFNPVNVPDYLINPRLTPQVSEFTRVKAFGRYLDTDEHTHPGGWVYGNVADSYNILYIKRFTPDFGSGFTKFEVAFANELKNEPVIVANCIYEEEGSYHFCCIESKSTTGFTLLTINIATGYPSLAKFDFHVF